MIEAHQYRCRSITEHHESYGAQREYNHYGADIKAKKRDIFGKMALALSQKSINKKNSNTKNSKSINHIFFRKVCISFICL